MCLDLPTQTPLLLKLGYCAFHFHFESARILTYAESTQAVFCISKVKIKLISRCWIFLQLSQSKL